MVEKQDTDFRRYFRDGRTGQGDRRQETGDRRGIQESGVRIQKGMGEVVTGSSYDIAFDTGE